MFLPYHINQSKGAVANTGVSLCGLPHLKKTGEKKARPFRFSGSDAEERRSTLVEVLTSPSAILDIQWSPHSSQQNVLCAATSTGNLAFYHLSPEGRLKHNVSLQLFKPSILVLSLAWHPNNAERISVTLSSGDVCLCNTSSTVNAVEKLAEHSLEAWTVSFSRNGLQVFSGGDDAILQCFGLSTTQDGPLTPAWQDRRIHGAGVTAILPLTDTLVVTGSYDDNIRLLQVTISGRRQVVAETNLAGGVWRLKLLGHQLADTPRQVRSLSQFVPHLM